MTRKFLLVALAAAATLVFGGVPAVALTVGTVTTVSGHGGSELPFSGTAQDICASAPVGYASCLAERIDPQTEHVNMGRFTGRFSPSRGGSSVVVSGLSPTNIENVYGFSTSQTAGSGETVAIVDAYDDPTAANDLSTFSTQYNLPACTTSNGCFTKVNQTGGTSLPQSNGGWALEISLDIEWAHATAPGANILLVEANSNSESDLYTAEQYAAGHANVVSNSWGGSEYSGETSDDQYFTSPSGKVTFFAATGDQGSAVDYPATSPNVVAVGGTTLSFTSGGVLSSETAWSSGGGGCSAYEPAPSVQKTASITQAGCSKRSVPDVSLDANPSSGVAVYDSTPYSGSTGWFTVGGTSVATPIWAAESTVAANAGTSITPQSVYSGAVPFRDITSGSNGHSALVGYDLATGLGSWATNAPGAVSGLSATGASGQVSLSWSAASGATGYEIYRGTASGKESTTALGSTTSTSFNDTTAKAGTTYYYEVEATNSAGAGMPSNEVSSASSSSGSAPSAPTGLKASASTGQVALSWSSATGASSYTVLRGASSGKETTTVATGVTTTTYNDTTVSAGNTYYYVVEAVNSVGPSGPSNEVSATVPSSGSSGQLVAGISKSCNRTACTFTSTSTDSGATISSYSWSGGNGLSGTASQVQHTFTAIGSFTVTLQVSDATPRSATASVTVNCTGLFGRPFSCS